MIKENKIIEKIKNIIYKSVPDAEIILYGSRAKGKSKKISDWDILILLNSSKISFDFEKKLMDDLFEIEIETGEIISPLLYTKYDWKNKYSFTPFYENIQKEGIRL